MWLHLALAAAAHEPGLSRVEWTGEALVLQVARVDAADPADLWAGTRVRLGDAPCALEPLAARPDDNGLLATAGVRCPGGGAATVEAGWFDQLPPGHRTVRAVGGKPVGWLDAGHRSFTVALPATRAGGGLLLLPVAAGAGALLLVRRRIRG